MALDERALYPRFSRFISSSWKDGGSAAFELKIVQPGCAYRFAQLADHQERALRMVRLPTGLYHKISDQSQGAKPFDSFLLANCAAYVVICFASKCYFVTIDNYLRLKQASPAKSVSEKEVAIYSSFDALI